ncbi:hypothetical protein [Streptomonospora alba]|nr:hypothetical protein [Streptomonospora alba]
MRGNMMPQENLRVKRRTRSVQRAGNGVGGYTARRRRLARRERA